MNGTSDDPHFVLVPLMAQGHMIPMLDFAQLLAQRGTLVTFVTTPFNASRIRPTINHAKDLNLPIHFLEIKLPCREMGIPQGGENIDILPYEHMFNFFNGLHLLAKPLERYLQWKKPYPTCMIADLCHPWTQQVAENLQIPRLTFFSICCFTLLCTHNISQYKVYDRVIDEHEPFDVPGLTEKIVVTKNQAPGFFVEPGWETYAKLVQDAEDAADGIVVNSFDGLEMKYIESYQKAKGKKVWAVGPFSLLNKDDLFAMEVRGNTASIDTNQCLSWLDSNKGRSVVYVSFGTLTFMGVSQLMEIGYGLEASNHSFILVIKKHEMTPEVEEWLSGKGGFEERVRSKGLIIKGWAPQVMILSHWAIGGLVTHCGWNSILEGVVTGVPMVTWPHFADQFLNERMIVDVLKVGIPIGTKKCATYVQSEVPLINRDVVKNAVNTLMDGGEEGEGRRQRAKEFGRRSKEAMKDGGSSYASISDLIHRFSVNGNKTDEGK